MSGRVELFVLLLLVGPSLGLLMSNENKPALIDRVLQLVWEPSSLIRVWVGLDQLYNIALSWRGVAKNLAALPFREGRSESHVMIQQPRSLKYHKPSVASQWDRFNEIYASSSLSPIVSHVGHSLPPSGYGHAFLENSLLRLPASLLSQQGLTFNNHRKSAGSLPALGGVFQGDSLLSSPSVLSQQRHILDSFKSPNGLHPYPPFGDVEDPLLASKLLYLQNQAALQRHPGGGATEPPSAALDSIGEKRLTALLRLLGTLGKIHANEPHRDSLQTSDE